MYDICLLPSREQATQEIPAAGLPPAPRWPKLLVCH
jgi:hypothetical protein